MGGQLLSISNAYMQGATRQEKDQLESVLAGWLEAAEESGEPCMIVGDFNSTRDELDISRWCEAAGWYELGGLRQPATFLPSRGLPRRLDWLLANRAVQPALCGDAVVRWDLGLKTHAAQVFSIELEHRLRYSCWQATTPLAASTADPAATAYWCEPAWASRQTA